MTIRLFRESDREEVCRITLDVFGPVAVDAAIEANFGLLNGVSWQDRKRKDLLAEVDGLPQGCFVAEEGGKVIGYVTTTVDTNTSVGRIGHLGVDAEHQGRHVGKALLSHALDYLEAQGLEYTQLETTVVNDRAMRFYVGVGYQEMARKLYYFMRLADRKDR